MKSKRIKLFTVAVTMFVILLASCEPVGEEKPVIYLYPEEPTNISVSMEYDGKLTCTYPKYGSGWKVKAYPDGKLINGPDKKEYSYLYWEGKSDYKWDITEGYVIEGEITAEFLQEKLSHLGLLPREYNEFIVYWLPKMESNKYNLIHFSQSDYAERVRLSVEPEPDSILRIHMVFKPLKKHINIQEQKLNMFERKGFTVIEWGGTELK